MEKIYTIKKRDEFIDNILKLSTIFGFSDIL